MSGLIEPKAEGSIVKNRFGALYLRTYYGEWAKLIVHQFSEPLDWKTLAEDDPILHAVWEQLKPGIDEVEALLHRTVDVMTQTETWLCTEICHKDLVYPACQDERHLSARGLIDDLKQALLAK